MSPDHSSRFDAVAATHALRDAEESARLRQLGALVVHDLNNALFALVGRAQLLRRSIQDPVLGSSADELLNTVRSLERQLTILQNACRIDRATHATNAHNCNAREALREALREIVATLPSSIQIDPPFSAENAFVQAIPRDAYFEGDAAQLTTALMQMLSLHRSRAPRSIAFAVCVEEVHDEPRLSITITDDAGPPQHALVAPSLLGDSFDLAALAIATANRAIRDFGGRASIARDDDAPHKNVPGTNPGTYPSGTEMLSRNRSVTRGLRTTISFEIRRESPASPGADTSESDGSTVGVVPARAWLRDAAMTCDQHEACVPVPRRVLVVDDDVSVRAVLAAVLDAINDDVETMDDPSAVDRRNDLHEFDVVILDAGGGGLEALSRMRGRGIDIPVLLASGGEIRLKPDARTRTAMKPIALHALDSELTLLAAMKARA